MSDTRKSQVADLDSCPCTGATLDKLIQPAILTVLAEEDLHGYKIAERLADMPPFEGQRPDVSGVYRFLRSMEDRSMVVGSWNLSERGPAKRLYRITAAGRECLSRWVHTLEVYRQAIGGLVEIAREAAGTPSCRHGAARRSGTTKKG